MSMISGELFLECQIVSHCGTTGLCHEPQGLSSLTVHVWTSFPIGTLTGNKKYIRNGLVTSNNRPNPRFFNSLHKYHMLGSKTNPISFLLTITAEQGREQEVQTFTPEAESLNSPVMSGGNAGKGSG